MDFPLVIPPPFTRHDQTELPMCDCDMYMPPGQHDPVRHQPGRGWMPLTKEMVEASKRAAEEAATQARLAEKARVSQREDWIKDTSLCANVTVQAIRENQLLRTTPNASTLGELSQALQRQSKTGVFTCGGVIPIDPAPSSSELGHATATSNAVNVRWGPDGHGRSLALPVGSPAADTALRQLISDCVPATFGRNGEDVYDENYRRAGALRADLFTTDFCPYKLGIVDHVVQLLLPSVTGDLEAYAENSISRGMRAELYKRTYTADRVDTPRGNTQVGSLVVCLPTEFQGGTLAVRHQGQEFRHEWASGSQEEDPSIHWAAFYSDCEHEVLEVTAGHRITLTYNLFLSTGTGLLHGGFPSIAPELLPLTHQVRRFLARPDALPAGGFLGIHLVHAYPHTHRKSHAFIPRMLKGADMAVYEALIACGLHGILTPRGHDQSLPLADIFRAISIQAPQGHIETHFEPLSPNENEGFVEEEGYDSPSTDWECEGSAPWWPRDDDGDEEYDMDQEGWSEEERRQLALEQWEEQLECEAENLHQKSLERRDTKRFERQIVWLNRVGNREISRVYVAYGNEAELKVKYSSVALIVKVPSWEERRAKVASTTTMVEEGAAMMVGH